MGYAYFDSNRLTDPKRWDVGLAAGGLDGNAILYASMHLTDGFIPSNVLNFLSRGAKTAPLVAKLVEAGIWTVDEEKGGYWIVNYLELNPTREEEIASVKRLSDRGKKAVAARWDKYRETKGEVMGNANSGEAEK